MKYAKMQTFASPRVVLPVSKDPEYCEPDRLYDLDTNSVRFIVDRCIEKDWFLPNYLTVEGRPYISLFVPDMTPGWQGSVERLQRIVDELHQYSRDMYKVEPYVVGSIRTVEQAKELTQAGVDALTGYAFLPVFGDNAAPIQYYNQLLEERKPDWRAICDINTFIPPAVVGWDASPRGKSMHQLGATTGHAYAPVVVDSTAEAFEQMLRDSLVFTSSAVPESERYGIICAWNEITEGASLLPQIGEDGTLDTAYLDVVRRVTSGEDYEPATT